MTWQRSWPIWAFVGGMAVMWAVGGHPARPVVPVPPPPLPTPTPTPNPAPQPGYVVDVGRDGAITVRITEKQ